MKAIVLATVLLLTGCSTVDKGDVLISLDGLTFYDCAFDSDPVCISVKRDIVK